MLARSRGVPAVMGLGADLAELSGQAMVDAHRGVLIVNPAHGHLARNSTAMRKAAATTRMLRGGRGDAASRDRAMARRFGSC